MYTSDLLNKGSGWMAISINPDGGQTGQSVINDASYPGTREESFLIAFFRLSNSPTSIWLYGTTRASAVIGCISFVVTSIPGYSHDRSVIISVE